MFGTVKFSNIYHPNTNIVNHVTCRIVVWELTCKLKVISLLLNVQASFKKQLHYEYTEVMPSLPKHFQPKSQRPKPSQAHDAKSRHFSQSFLAFFSLPASDPFSKSTFGEGIAEDWDHTGAQAD